MTSIPAEVNTASNAIAIEELDRGVTAASAVAKLIAPVLGWDPETAHQEVERYLSRVDAERESQSRTDDSAADRARRAAPDLFDGVTR